MKIFDLLTPRHVAWVALAAGLSYLAVASASGDYWMLVLILWAAPLLLLTAALWVRHVTGAWAAAVLGLLLVLLTWTGGLLLGLIPGLIGLAAFLAEWPHLHRPHAPTAGP